MLRSSSSASLRWLSRALREPTCSQGISANVAPKTLTYPLHVEIQRYEVNKIKTDPINTRMTILIKNATLDISSRYIIYITHRQITRLNVEIRPRRFDGCCSCSCAVLSGHRPVHAQGISADVVPRRCPKVPKGIHM